MGREKWATIKYERLSDFYYGCGRLGHTSQHCGEEVVISELNPGFPCYDPWLSSVDPKYSPRSPNHMGQIKERCFELPKGRNKRQNAEMEEPHSEQRGQRVVDQACRHSASDLCNECV